MSRKNFEMYDPELDYYFLIRVKTEEGYLYAYNQRILVRHVDFAKRFGTRRSARRCISLSEYENYEILPVKREGRL